MEEYPEEPQAKMEAARNLRSASRREESLEERTSPIAVDDSLYQPLEEVVPPQEFVPLLEAMDLLEQEAADSPYLRHLLEQEAVNSIRRSEPGGGPPATRSKPWQRYLYQAA